MDGVFMKKIAKLMVLCLLLLSAVWFGSVLSDRNALREDIIRLHVVAESDSQEDQTVKLQVRDAILAQLQSAMENLPDAETAKSYIQNHLPQLQETANLVLEQAGVAARAVVTLGKEAFPTREYETFTLPAGVYESLRITIGTGQGHNWWCVVFPTFCVSATSDGMADTAVSAGFSQSLAGSLTGEKPYQVRFFLLDCMGWVENLFHK